MDSAASTKNSIFKICRRMLCNEQRNVATQTDIDLLSFAILETQEGGLIPDNTSTPNKRRSARAGPSPVFPVFPSFITRKNTDDQETDGKSSQNLESLMTDDENSKILDFEEIDKILTEDDNKNVLTCEEINELLSLLNSIL